MVEKLEKWFIYCSTGCTCCSSENHMTGPYDSLLQALEVCESYEKYSRLSSQYFPNGNYTIYKKECTRIVAEGRDLLLITKNYYLDLAEDDLEYSLPCDLSWEMEICR